MDNLNLKIKMLTKTATRPTKAHEDDACFDIYADVPNEKTIIIKPHTTQKIHTGLSTEIPIGYWGAIFARSGIATKKGLRPAQGVPVIDSGYRGEWLIPLHNDSDVEEIVEHGERIAQFTLLPYPHINLIDVEELENTDRGETGFGNSGRF